MMQTDVVLSKGYKRVNFAMSPTSDTNDQLPASAWFSLLLDKWPDPKIRADFTLSCGNCHQIGAYRFRRAKTDDEWRSVLTQMMVNLPPYFQQTRDQLIDTVIATYGPNATYPTLPIPPPPSGEVLKAVTYASTSSVPPPAARAATTSARADNRVYADAGLRWIDPRTSERGLYPFAGGSHSIERAPDGSMYITQAGSNSLAEVFVDGVTPPYYPLPNLNGVQGAYPHQPLRLAWRDVDDTDEVESGVLVRSGDGPVRVSSTADADPAEVGLSIPVAYGCDIAPDDTVWWSQLFGSASDITSPRPTR